MGSLERLGEEMTVEIAGPHNLEAERSLIGCCIAAPEMVAEVGDLVESGMFYDSMHRSLWEAVVTYRDQKMPADKVLFDDHLSRFYMSKLDREKDEVIACLTGFWDAPNARFYADIIRRNAIARGYIGAGLQIAEVARKADEENDLTGQVDEIINSARPLAAGENTAIGAKPLHNPTESTKNGVFTGLLSLDQLRGPMLPGQIILIASRPKIG